jgi:hypothetical protein
MHVGAEDEGKAVRAEDERAAGTKDEGEGAAARIEERG